jgi:hypothetical protein
LRDTPKERGIMAQIARYRELDKRGDEQYKRCTVHRVFHKNRRPPPELHFEGVLQISNNNNLILFSLD